MSSWRKISVNQVKKPAAGGFFGSPPGKGEGRIGICQPMQGGQRPPLLRDPFGRPSVRCCNRAR